MLRHRPPGLLLLLILGLPSLGRTPGQPAPAQTLNPDSIKIELKRGERRQAKEPEPFVVGDLFSFHLLVTNSSAEEFPRFVESQVLLQERPVLRREGKPVAYREGTAARLRAGPAIESQPMRPGLFPHQSKTIDSFVLEDWFEPLPAGNYQVVVRYRFQPEQEWRESSIIFEVLPADPGLSKTPFTSDSLSAVVDEMTRGVLRKKPACRHQRTTPILGTENLMIDVWVCGRERVLSHILETPSAADAAQALKKRYPEANERVTGLGDEGLVVSGNIVVFRKGRLLIDVSSGGNSSTPEFGQQVKRNKEFAQYLADALPVKGIYGAANLTRAPFATAAQLKISLGPPDYSTDSPAQTSTQFKAGDKIIFKLVMTNVSAAPVKAQLYFNLLQNRPELFREGKRVPYLSEVPKPVSWDKVSIDYGKIVFVLLQPNQSQMAETINLADWYGRLLPGHYRLSNQHRLDVWQGELVDCGSITFEVIP